MAMPATSDVCTGLQTSVDVFLQHLYAAHLETGVGQQVTDALNLDQYLKTHLVLVENMLKPLLGGTQQTLDAFLQHVYSAHLETSVGQQVTDALNLDQYLKTHLVLVENMLKPLLGGTQQTLDAFLQHVYSAHLETSLGQQVNDALSVDQYVKTHTVWVESLIKPLVGADLSSC